MNIHTLPDGSTIDKVQQERNRQAWVEALESNEYEQAREALVAIEVNAEEPLGSENRRKERFCCLGVACEVAIKAGVPWLRRNPTHPDQYQYLEVVDEEGVDGEPVIDWMEYEDGELPPPVVLWLGLSDNAGMLTAEAKQSLPYTDQRGHELYAGHLVQVNDDVKMDFRGIAALVREGKVKVV